MSDHIAHLEAQLNDLDPGRRREALDALLLLVDREEVVFPPPGRAVNIHGHTFFSFNGYGWSPTYFAWRARKEGLLAAGVVDFDVLDGADEMLEAGRLLGLRTTAGLETRVYFEAMAGKEMSSPGEPGVNYFMGVGFPSGDVAESQVLAELKETAQRRNLAILERVNPHLAPVQLDYDADVLPLTPNGNATERHLCEAYDQKARAHFGDDAAAAAFWAGTLGIDEAEAAKALESPPVIQGLIRAKTMKKGGVGYIQASGPDFPRLERVRDFILAAGAIPAYAYLDGMSDGESEPERLLDTFMEAGTAAVNIIPDRNWNLKDPEQKRVKVAHFHRFVSAARDRDLPISIGTEMNAYGQRFVDDFEAPEMAAVAHEFTRGALLLYGHTALQRAHGMGYLSPWARGQFTTTAAKNDFYVELGKALPPGDPSVAMRVSPAMTPDAALAAVRQP